jgi:hypothetical protein
MVIFRVDDKNLKGKYQVLYFGEDRKDCIRRRSLSFHTQLPAPRPLNINGEVGS